MTFKTGSKSLFEKSFWVKLFALKPSFFFKTRFLPQSRTASTIQRHIITIFSKPCQVNRRGLVSKPDGLGDPTPTLCCGSLWIDKSTAPWDHPLLFKTGSKSLFEKSFWAKLFARKPSFFFKTRFLPQSRKAYTIQTHIIIIFSKPCQINDRDLVFKPDGLGESTATPQCRSQWIAKSTALGNNLLLFKTGSK